MDASRLLARRDRHCAPFWFDSRARRVPGKTIDWRCIFHSFVRIFYNETRGRDGTRERSLTGRRSDLATGRASNEEAGQRSLLRAALVAHAYGAVRVSARTTRMRSNRPRPPL